MPAAAAITTTSRPPRSSPPPKFPARCFLACGLVVSSTNLVLLALSPEVDVAGCHHRHSSSSSGGMDDDDDTFASSSYASSPPPPLSLSALIEQENDPGALIIAAWMLRCVVVLSLLRLVTHAIFISARQYKHHPRHNNLDRLMHFLTAANVAVSTVSCGMVLTTMLIVAEWVNEQADSRCKFTNGASPFLGLLVAASGLGCAAAALDVISLMSHAEDRHEEGYEHLGAKERQRVVVVGGGGGNAEEDEVSMDNLADDDDDDDDDCKSR